MSQPKVKGRWGDGVLFTSYLIHSRLVPLFGPKVKNFFRDK